MKIEKVSDTQFRCILTREDLAQRKLKLSELAYGTARAKKLFQEILREAAVRFGFFAENTPIMIEAVPLSSESIVLVVTKVNNPEELDTRFSNFSPSVQREVGNQDREEDPETSPFDDLMEAIRRRSSSPSDSQREDSSSAMAREMKARARYVYTHRLFVFDSLGDAAHAAAVSGNFTGESSLYRKEPEDIYYLLLTMKDADEVVSSQSVLSVLSEYGEPVPIPLAARQYLNEHCTMLRDKDALTVLKKI